MSNINGNIQIVYFSLNFTFTRFLTTVRGTRYQRSGTSCSHHLASSVVNYVLRKLEISVQAFALLTERNVHTNVLNQTNMCMCENYRLPSPGRAATVPIANVRPFDCVNRKDRSGRQCLMCVRKARRVDVVSTGVLLIFRFGSICFD